MDAMNKTNIFGLTKSKRFCMFKNRKGFAGLLLNPLVLFITAVALILLMFGLPNSPFGLAILSHFDFAGFSWKDSGNIANACQIGSAGSDVTKTGDFLEIKHSSSNNGGNRYIETDITSVDEVLIIYEGYASATCSNGYSNNGASISSSIQGSISGSVGSSLSADAVGCPSGSHSASLTFPPSIWKFRNNFDGTWSSLQGLGVGDVFVVKSTGKIEGNALLRIGASSGGGCGSSGGGANSYIKIYNVVRKENAFALCKADKYAYDANGDGKIAADGSECVDLKTIVINSEEAIKESFDEKLARITAELEAKNAGLTADITALKQQLAQQQTTEQITSLQQQIQQLEADLVTASDKTAIQSQIDNLRQQQLDSGNLQDQLSALQAELRETKAVLADVQAKDKNVINTIDAQEQFKKPNFIKELWNNFIARIKNIFR